MLKKVWKDLLEFFSDEENPEEPIYDPVEFAAMLVFTFFGIGLLFWLLWTLLVYQGGIVPKIFPALQILFGGKKLSDFGCVGYPYELGVFEGFVANTAALIIVLALVCAVWLLFRDNLNSKEGSSS